MNTPIRVVIVEDHALTRVGLRSLLTDAGIAVVGEAADGVTGLATVLAEKPAVAIIDLGLPGRDGLSVTREIKAQAPDIGVVIMTMADLDQNVREALQAGADAYCVKAGDLGVLLDAVRAVAGGGAYFDPAIARVALRALGGDAEKPEPRPLLTARELDVLKLIAQGKSNHEIARELYISLGTVKGHVADILGKLLASDRAQAAVNAFRLGLLS